MHTGTRPRSRAAARARWRIVRGLSPVMSRNVRPKVPRLFQPVPNAMSVTGRSVSRSSAVARSMRRVSKYRCGGRPNACLNECAKCASDTRLTAARRRTGHSSCEAPSMRSFARSRRRSSSGSWPMAPMLAYGARDIRALAPPVRVGDGQVRAHAVIASPARAAAAPPPTIAPSSRPSPRGAPNLAPCRSSDGP